MRAKSKVEFRFFTHRISRVINQPLTKSCDLRWVGAAFDGRGASPNDWLLLRRVTRNMCSNKFNRRPRKGKSLGFDEPTDSNSTDDSDEKYRLIIN